MGTRRDNPQAFSANEQLIAGPAKTAAVCVRTSLDPEHFSSSPCETDKLCPGSTVEFANHMARNEHCIASGGDFIREADLRVLSCDALTREANRELRAIVKRDFGDRRPCGQEPTRGD